MRQKKIILKVKNLSKSTFLISLLATCFHIYCFQNALNAVWDNLIFKTFRECMPLHPLPEARTSGAPRLLRLAPSPCWITHTLPKNNLPLLRAGPTLCPIWDRFRYRFDFLLLIQSHRKICLKMIEKEKPCSWRKKKHLKLWVCAGVRCRGI